MCFAPYMWCIIIIDKENKTIMEDTYMKKRLLVFALLLTISASAFYSNGITCHASGLTWEGLREYVKEHGGPASGGTHRELSNCPGQDIPNSSNVPETGNNQQLENEPETKPQPVHEHSYIKTVTKEPTCVEEGVTTFTCSCGDKYTESIEMIEHDYSKRIIVQEPTCTENGKVLISCSVCNDTYEEDIKPLGHEKGEWVTTKEPTCTETGNEVISCKRCGEQLEERSINALGHDDGQWITAKGNTLFTEGLKELRCTTCDEVLDTEVIPIDRNAWYIIIGVSTAIVIAITVIGISVNIKKKQKTIK